MIKIYIGTNTSRQTDIVSPDSVVRDLLDKYGVNANGQIQLDGVILSASDLGKTLDELNAKNPCYLLSVAKHDNATEI